MNTETRISEAELTVAKVAQDLKPISEKITAIEKLQKNLVTYESNREKVKTR